MKKTIFYLSSILFISLVSCKEKMPESLSPQTVKIEGNMGEYFEVVKGKYPISESSSRFDFKVKKIKEVETDNEYVDKMGIGYVLYDEKGNVVLSNEGELRDSDSPSLCTSFLSLKAGEIGDAWVYMEEWPAGLKGANTFKIIMNWDCKPYNDLSSDLSSTSSNNDSKVDEFLAEYEKLIDEYDKYITEMKSGNVDMNHAMKMVEKAQSVQEKLQGMEKEMTPVQVQKFTKLISKLTSLSTKAASVNPSEIKSINGVNLPGL